MPDFTAAKDVLRSADPVVRSHVRDLLSQLGKFATETAVETLRAPDAPEATGGTPLDDLVAQSGAQADRTDRMVADMREAEKLVSDSLSLALRIATTAAIAVI